MEETPDVFGQASSTFVHFEVTEAVLIFLSSVNSMSGECYSATCRKAAGSDDIPGRVLRD